MRLKVVPIVVGALGMVPKGLEKRLEELEISGRIKAIQSTAMLRWARILRRVPGDLMRLGVTQTPVKDKYKSFCSHQCKDYIELWLAHLSANWTLVGISLQQYHIVSLVSG